MVSTVSSSTDPSRIAEVNRPERIREQIAQLRQEKPAPDVAAAEPPRSAKRRTTW